MQLSTEIKNARLQAIGDAIDAGNARLKLLNTEQAVVCELPFTIPSASNISSGALTFNTLPESLVLLSDDIDSGVIVGDDDALIASLTVGDMDSSADLKLPSLTVYQGSLLRINGWTISEL